MPVYGNEYYVLSEEEYTAIQQLGGFDDFLDAFNAPVDGYYYADPSLVEEWILFLLDEGVDVPMGYYMLSTKWQIGV